MKIALSLHYSHLFPPPDNPEELFKKLIDDTDLIDVLVVTCTLMNMLGVNHMDLENEEDTFNKFLDHFRDKGFKNQALQKYKYLKYNSEKSGHSLSLFNTYYIHNFLVEAIKSKKTDVISSELNKDIDFTESSKNITDSSFQNIFKAYLLSIEIIENNYAEQLEGKVIKNGKGNFKEFFYKILMPMMIRQHYDNQDIEPLIELAKLFSFVRFIFFDNKLKKYSDEYLNFYQCNYNEFFGRLIDCINIALLKTEEGRLRYVINSDNLSEINKRFFDEFLVCDFNKIVLENDFFIKKPVAKFKDKYIVVNRFLLVNHIKNRLKDDLYEKTNVKEIFGNNEYSQSNYNSHISKLFYEDIHFKALIEGIFSKKRIVWGDIDPVAYPDAFVLNGNDLYFFEFKDISFSDSLMLNLTYENISEHINKRLCTKKGYPQLLKKINKFYNSNSYDHILNQPKNKYKIYPILILNDTMYSAYGFQSYINDKYIEDLKQYNFKTEPLTIFNYDKLLSVLPMLRNKQITLKSMIKSYHKRINNYVNVITKNASINDYSKAFQPIESIAYNNIQRISKEEFVNLILKDFQIDDFLKYLDSQNVNVH